MACNHKKPRRYLMCGFCWDKLPKAAKHPRVLSEDRSGSPSLRWNPTDKWLNLVAKERIKGLEAA